MFIGCCVRRSMIAGACVLTAALAQFGKEGA
jgi:hypothetical protein